MTRPEISTKVINALRPFIPERKSVGITESMHIIDDLDVNSARLVDIVLELEDLFGITIDDAIMDRLATIGDLVDVVQHLTGNPSVPDDPVVHAGA
jgi:acyl carrier protein